MTVWSSAGTLKQYFGAGLIMDSTNPLLKSFKEKVCQIPDIKTERIELLWKIGGESLLKELLRTALDNMLKRSDEMSRALSLSNMDGVRKAAHSIKSSLGNIGLDSLMLLARHIEEDETIKPEQIDELLKKIHILKGDIEELFEKERI